MNENRRQILEMLAKGQVTSDEAERLISALEKNAPATASSASAGPGTKAKAKYLRVVVEPNDHTTGKHAPKVNIRVPMQLLRAGVKLASLLPVQARGPVNAALHAHGIQFDLGQIKPENLEELIDHLEDLTADVDDKDVKVRVFCE
jgi:hypothetical protein